MREPVDEAISEARHIVVGGRVQGVGFRPFVFRLAVRFDIRGWVRNEAGTVHIHAEGPAEKLDLFLRGLVDETPALAYAERVSARQAELERFADFTIGESRHDGRADIHLPPDLFVCDDCLKEMSDPDTRRHNYPFINCTQCGPRYTIIRALPYDRPQTTMAGFPLCPDCKREYEDPRDRRFHAQPLACPRCGPHCTFETAGRRIDDTESAIAATLDALRDGRAVAVKGVGGYHLMADALNGDAIAALRQRKHRPDKPLAVMFPMGEGDPLGRLRAMLAPNEAESAALLDPARPIVLVRRTGNCPLPGNIAPGLAEIGAFLPYSPLHHLLLDAFGGPLVATSGNVSGEPVLTSQQDARTRLAPIADAFLHHDRPIERPADDSVLHASAGAVRAIRLGRGIAPLELTLPFELGEPVLAAGGHMKSTIALGFGRRMVVSPHIGELDSPRSLDVFDRVARDLQALYGVSAARVLCDAHPRYASTRWAKKSGLPMTGVFHHHAHAAALAFERPEIGRWLVFTWDGIGLGADGTLWGGETLSGRPGNWTRTGSIVTFRPVGGEQAARAPWRSAAALCWQAGLKFPRRIDGLELARQGWDREINAPQTSAVGRLFDAAACLVLGIDRSSFEGQGPMLLEAAAGDEGDVVDLPLVHDGEAIRIDWSPLLPYLADTRIPARRRAAGLHETLASAALKQARAIAGSHPFDAVGMSGGVFQNRRLAEATKRRFEAAGIFLHIPERIPVNDAGLAPGQIVEFAGRRDTRSSNG